MLVGQLLKDRRQLSDGTREVNRRQIERRTLFAYLLLNRNPVSYELRSTIASMMLKTECAVLWLLPNYCWLQEHPA